jgi:NitT/TauT family transport system substrate-binding protein
MRRTGTLTLRALCVLVAGAAFAPAQAQLKTWRHGIVEAKSDAGFVMMASRRGFAEKQGLTIEMIQFKGDALALKALIAGELDSYEGSPGGPMIAASRGADVRIIGCYWPGLTYGIFAKPAIASPQNLKGKSFAISAPGALPDLLARVVLETNNIPGSTVRFAMLGSDSDRYRALAAGTVDAAAASTEFVPMAGKSGLKLLVHGHDAAPSYLRFCTYVSSKTLADRRGEAARFLAAQMAALRYALANRDEEIKLTKEATNEKPEDERAAYIFDEVVRLSAIDPMMPIPLEKLAWMQELLVRTGNLTKPIDPASIVDDSVRRKAVEIVEK